MASDTSGPESAIRTEQTEAPGITSAMIEAIAVPCPKLSFSILLAGSTRSRNPARIPCRSKPESELTLVFSQAVQESIPQRVIGDGHNQSAPVAGQRGDLHLNLRLGLR